MQESATTSKEKLAQPVEVARTPEQIQFEESLATYETFGIRGFTWFLPYIKEVTSGSDFQQMVVDFESNPTPELSEYFLSWGAEISQLIAALLALVKASQAITLTPASPQTLAELQQEKLEQFMHYQSTCLQFMRSHEQVAPFARTVSKARVPLDDLEPAYRIHFLKLFAHDIQGSRMLMILNSALEYLIEDFEANVRGGIAAMASDNLRKIPQVLERHTFDTNVAAELRGTELIFQLESIRRELQINFPQLRTNVHYSFNNMNISGEVYSITLDMFKLLIDNCAANAVKAGASEVAIDFIRKSDWLYIVFSDNGPGFSSKHTFGRTGEVAPGYILAQVALETGKSIWDKAGTLGTGIGLAEIQKYLLESNGTLFAGNRMVSGLTAGGAVVAVIPAAKLVE